MFFKVGDIVRIKPSKECKNTPGGPGFTEIMRDYCGSTFTIEQSVYPNTWIRYQGYYWLPEWLEPVDEAKKILYTIHSELNKE
jgi:hypothetical protein